MNRALSLSQIVAGPVLKDYAQNASSASETKIVSDTAIFAGGCFWGVQYLMEHAQGVISTKVGYAGGHVKNPSYKEVCNGNTGHVETLEIVFDPLKTTFENIAKLFFEIHDFSQVDGQGPDIGEQYHSVIFYTSDKQKEIAEKLIGILQNKGYSVATSLRKFDAFWEAEDYHQLYYDKNGKQPYCHVRRQIEWGR